MIYKVERYVGMVGSDGIEILEKIPMKASGKYPVEDTMVDRSYMGQTLKVVTNGDGTEQAGFISFRIEGATTVIEAFEKAPAAMVAELKKQGLEEKGPDEKTEE